MGGPAFTTNEDSRFGGSVTITGLRSCWMGMFRNHVAGTVRIKFNRFADPDADEIQTNTIGGDLICRGTRRRRSRATPPVWSTPVPA